MLDHHPELDLQFDAAGMGVVLKKTRTNLLGNFPGGEIAYVANAAAGMHCIAEDRLAETASLNVECLARAAGDVLIARATTVKAGKRLIRLRLDIFVRDGGGEKLVAIAQANMTPIGDSDVKALFP